MDIEVKKRLKSVIAYLNISNLDIAKKTGYTPTHVSLSLNPNKDVLTDKFISKIWESYPEIKDKFRDYILDGTGNESNLFGNAKTNDANFEAKLEALTNENKMLKEAVVKYEKEIDWFKTMLERAFAIYPELQGKLFSPLTENGNFELNSSNLPLRDYVRDNVAA